MKLSGSRLLNVMQFLFFAAQVSPSMPKLAIHLKTSSCKLNVEGKVIFSLLYNTFFGVASFSHLNILNITLNINIDVVIWKGIYLLLSRRFMTRFFLNMFCHMWRAPYLPKSLKISPSNIFVLFQILNDTNKFLGGQKWLNKY